MTKPGWDFLKERVKPVVNITALFKILIELKVNYALFSLFCCVCFCSFSFGVRGE